jgi:hypothetical protein
MCAKTVAVETRFGGKLFWRENDSGKSFQTIKNFGGHVSARVARFFLEQYTKTGENIPIYHKITK